MISAKCRFILEIVNETLIIHKQTKAYIQSQLKEKDYPLINGTYDYLMKLPIYNLTQEEIDKLIKQNDMI